MQERPLAYDLRTIEDAAFEWFREEGFPYRKLPRHVCMQEINDLSRTMPSALLGTTLGYQVADTYHPHRYHSHAEGMKAPYEGFMTDKLLRRAIRLQLENDMPVPDSYFGSLNVVSGVQSCSNFRPGFAVLLYRKFCPQGGAVVLDTSTGYGGRLIGAIASGVVKHYLGIDPNKETHKSNLRMAKDLGFADRVTLWNRPAEDVSPTDTVLSYYVEEGIDFAFTSPPYFAKEHYSDDDTQSWVRYKEGEDWLRGFLVPMLQLQYDCLKPDAYAVVNIADVKLRNKIYPLVRWCVWAAKRVGFTYEGRLHFDLGRRFGAGNSEEVQTEPVLIFRKPESL